MAGLTDIPLYEAPRFSSIPEILSRAAESRPDQPFITDLSVEGAAGVVSYGGMLGRAEGFVRGILGRHDRPVVGILGRNGIDWATAYLGTLRAGGVAVPIDRKLSPPEVHAILHYSRANVLVVDEFLLQDLSEHLGRGREMDVLVMRAEEPGARGSVHDLLRSAGERTLPQLNVYDMDAPASICYTSGTMGKSKGVVLSHGNLLSDVLQTLRHLKLYPDDRFLSVLPVHHTFECTGGFLAPMAMGSEIHICRGLKYIAEDLRKSRATVMLGVPLLWESMYARIMKGIRSRPLGLLSYRLGRVVCSVSRLVGLDVRRAVFSSVHGIFGGRLRLVVSGGAAVDPEVARGYEELGLQFIQGYGLTECSPIVAVNRDCCNRIGSVGPVLPDMEARIDDPDEDGVGELLVRGPNVMRGYHEDPESTSEVLDQHGWLRTGDLGYLDDDGFLYITGRKKNVIVAKNGKNVYPEEIERMLNRSQAVQESMVFGRRSESKGEEVWAIIVPDVDRFIGIAEWEGASLNRDRVVKSLGKAVREYNASQQPYRMIRRFLVREEELPKTTTNKIVRREVLREAGLEHEEIYRP
jgi:long-chain acyl-CoA synthetase